MAFAHSGRNSGSLLSNPMTLRAPPSFFTSAWVAAVVASQSEPLTSSMVRPAAASRSALAS